MSKQQTKHNRTRKSRSLGHNGIQHKSIPSLSTNGVSQFATVSKEDRDEINRLTGPRLTKNILKFVTNMTQTLRNPDKIDLRTYHNMAETDETLQSGIELISLSAAAMLGDYSHPKDYIQQGVQAAITNLQEGWYQFWDELITDGITYGFGNAEICMSTELNEETGKLSTNLDALIGINPMSGLFKVDLEEGSKTYGDMQAFVQWPMSPFKKVIPAEKMVSWAHKSRHSNPFGRSRLKCVWKNWVIKDQMLKAWALAMERTGSPLTWIKTADGQRPVKDEDGNDLDFTRAEYLLGILEDLQNTTGFVIEGEEEVGNIQTPRSVGNDFKIIVDHMNAMMYRGLLIPILLLDTSDIGSNALAQQHFKVYIMSMARLMQSLLPAVIRSVIKQFIIANYGYQKTYGEFAVKQIGEDDLKLLSDVFYAMTQEGYLTPKHKADMDLIRKKIGAASVNDEDHKQIIAWAKEDALAAAAPKAGSIGGKSPSGRENNPGGATPSKPGSLPTPKAPSKVQGRPAKKK